MAGQATHLSDEGGVSAFAGAGRAAEQDDFLGKAEIVMADFLFQPAPDSIEDELGIFDFEVNAPYRKAGVGRYFLSLIMKYIQDQFFTLVELQLDETNQPGLNFLRSLDFEIVDTGDVFTRNA